MNTNAHALLRGTPNDSCFDARTLAEAYETMKAEIAAVPDEWIVRVMLDVPRAAQLGFGAAERVDLLLPELERLDFYDARPARLLRSHAAAALHAHLVANDPNPGEDGRLPDMLRDGRVLAGDLLVAAESLAHFGLVSAERVASIRSRTGNLAMASRLSALSTMLGDHWDEVEDKVPITRPMVARAAELGLQLQIALGIRRVERGTIRRSEARKTRAQAFTLYVRAYDTCRRGVTFLRWNEGDTDWYVPSLYGRRRRRRALRPQRATLETPAMELAPNTDAAA